MNKRIAGFLFMLMVGIGIKEANSRVNNEDIFTEFNRFNTAVLENHISKSDALKELQRLMPLIRTYYYKHNGKHVDSTSWIFPLRSYGPQSIGGKNGSGYIPNGYDYFDGNKHGGHPAQDIFIKDFNRDCLDDATKKEVDVLSVSPGVVIACQASWDTSSILRGGKYIWVYDPSNNSFLYYAHNNRILVKPGDIVSPGDVIATVGRTGYSAFKKRSPTHLHLMELQLDNSYYPMPVNCYINLLKARVRK